MKKIVMFFAAVLCCMSLAFSDPVEGVWKSIDENSGKVTAVWNIYVENGVLFGKIISVPEQDDSTIAASCKPSYKNFPVAGDVSKMTVVGTPFIYNLQKKEEGVWKGGNIIDPGNGSCYTCAITWHGADGDKFKEETLEMRGSIGPIGRSQFWIKQ